MPEHASVVSVGVSGRPGETEEGREQWRLWVSRPNKVRTEFAFGDETVTAVIDEGTWWSWSPSLGARTNGGDPSFEHGRGPGYALTDPDSVLSVLNLDIRSTARVAGRSAVVARATPPKGGNEMEQAEILGLLHGLGSGSDEYELAIDEERGIILRSEARLEGLPFRIVEMEAVAFDESLAPEVFTLVPPAGEAFQTVRSPRSIRLNELPANLGFTVLIPEGMANWIDRVDLWPEDRRRGVPQQLFLTPLLPSSGPAPELFIREAAEAVPVPAGIRWEDEDGLVSGVDHHTSPPTNRVRLRKHGTHVEISSYTLPPERLLELARSLRPLHQG